MHSCCAPCLIAPYMNLKNEFDLSAFWSNYNIHPYLEYQKRLNSFLDFTKKWQIKTIVKGKYDLKQFLQDICFREKYRCQICYYNRLKYTAIVAKRGKFDYFSTTLLYSKFQNHNRIIEIAQNLALEYGVKFYYQDFRKYWKKGIEESKKEKMYRQNYCGCIYSESERYQP